MRDAAEIAVRGVRRDFGVAALAALLVAAVAVLTVTGGDDDDGGQAVTQLVDIHGLAAPAWAPQLHVATHHGLVRRDADGVWRQVGGQAHDFMGFSAHPTAAGMFYASGHPGPGSRLPNPLGLMVSTDGGDTWQPRSLQGAADFHTMAVHPADGDVVYAWNGMGRPGLYHSTDAGRSWDVVTVDAFDHPLALAVHPDGPGQVWAATEQGLLRSTDTGRSWQSVFTGAPVTAIAFDAATPGRVLAYAAEPGEGLLESTDEGRTWRAVGWTFPGSAVSHLLVAADAPSHLYAATFGRDLLESRDGGRTWDVLARDGDLAAGD